MLLLTSLSIFIWTLVIRISTHLEPIADEVCVLGEWRENSFLPPHHSSPRVFGSLFTWLLAPIWRLEYTLGFLVIIMIAALLIFKIFSLSVIQLSGENPSFKSKITFTALATPWILFTLPPNKSALFDSVFWFGGSWHLIGALVFSYTVLQILSQERNGNFIYLWILIASFWSETTACLILIVMFLNLGKDKNYRKALVLPIAGVALNIFANLNSERINDVQESALRNNLDILKGSLKMLIEYGLRSVFIAIILTVIFLPFSSEYRNVPTKRIIWMMLLTTSGMVSIYLVGYPTWRSSSIIGLTCFTLSFLFFGRISKNASSILVSILVTLILGLNTVSNLNSIETVSAERSNWWSSVVTSNETLSPFKFTGEKPEFLQADYGSSEWIDRCFQDFKAKEVK